MNITKPGRPFCFIMSGLIALICFAACNNADQSTVNPVSPEESSQVADLRKLDTALSFPGLWVNKKYVDEIRKSRSPSVALIPETSCIIIPTKTLKQTSLIYGFHEGQEAVVVRNSGHFELWDLKTKNKLRNINLINEDEMMLGDDAFVRLRSGDLSGEINPYNIVDLVLFKGRFRNEQGDAVEFSNHGTVKGIPGISHYEAALDYADSEMQLDQLSLGETRSALKNYAFRFNGDTLNVFEMTCKKMGKNSICEEFAFGKKYLMLIREKER